MGTAGASPLCPDPPLQVVAVVMDMFTDVDLLSEVLEAAARRVPVYILLDEMNAQHFLDMADKCRVNLHHVDVSSREWEIGEDPRQRSDSPPSPVPAGTDCGGPHLLLPHWEVLQGPRQGEVPAGGLCRGDEWELQVRPRASLTPFSGASSCSPSTPFPHQGPPCQEPLSCIPASSPPHPMPTGLQCPRSSSV